MIQFIVGFLFSFLTSALALPLGDSPIPIRCPPIAPLQNLQLNQILGGWRVGYIFFGKQAQSLNEEKICFVVDIASKNNSATFSLHMDLYNETTIINQTAAAFPLRFVSPAEWKVNGEDFMHGRVIGSSVEHMIVTFCGPDGGFDFGKEEEENLDWRTFFEPSRSLLHHGTLLDRKNFKGRHLWTVILLKHKDISALKFVEFATILMNHGYDFTRGELVSFGKCPG